jgi:hypothetical protein
MTAEYERANVQLNRPQAIALIKELVTAKLIEPSWISIEKTNKDAYQIKIKCVHDISDIAQFCTKNELVMDEQNGFCLISKP